MRLYFVVLFFVFVTSEKVKRDTSQMNMLEHRIMRASHIAASRSRPAPKELMRAAEMIESNMTAKLSQKELSIANEQSQQILGRSTEFRRR